MPDKEPVGDYSIISPWSPHRQHTNDGRDAFDREIRVGDLLLTIYNTSDKSYLRTNVVDRVGFGKNGTSVSIVTRSGQHSYSEPLRNSGRSVILERNYEQR